LKCPAFNEMNFHENMKLRCGKPSGYNLNKFTPYIKTSLNPVPNAQVCVFDGTYYKITTTNYISKTSLYNTFSMYPLGPWPLKILMFALLVTPEIATYSDPRLGPGMHFLHSDTCAEGGLFISARVFFPV
jgi:hypothetical protein